MRPAYVTCLAAAVVVLLTGCSSPSKVTDRPKNPGNTDDKVISDMRQQGLSQPSHFYLTEINSKAMRDFVSSYSNATDPKWVKYRGGFVVYFFRNGMRYKVYYTPTGGHKCTIRQYAAEYLPFELRRLVETAFQGYSIFLVSEVTKMGKTRYEIKIEDESTFKEIRIEEGGIKTINDYVKSK